MVAACFGLALADRFLIYALFQGELLSLWGILVHFLVLTAMGLAAWQIAQVGKLVGPVSVALSADLAVRLRGVERCVTRHRAARAGRMPLVKRLPVHE